MGEFKKSKLLAPEETLILNMVIESIKQNLDY